MLSNWNCTWLEEIAWLHWLEAKLPNTLKFFSSNKKPVTADFLPSSWLAESYRGRTVFIITVKLSNQYDPLTAMINLM